MDGGQALPRIAEALRGARSHVHIAGWHIAPDFGLTRDASASRLRDLLGELSERVVVLELPGVSHRTMALLGPVDGLFVDG